MAEEERAVERAHVEEREGRQVLDLTLEHWKNLRREAFRQIRRRGEAGFL
jgi:hypothetical protein